MGDYELLSKIKSPADVKRLDEKDLAKLCSEFRRCGTYRGTPQNF